MTRTRIALLCAALTISGAGLAEAQGRGGGAGDDSGGAVPGRQLIKERPPKPPTAESEAWLSKEVQVGDWQVIGKDADGAILAHPTGTVRSDGVVPMHLRIEYRTPLTINRRQVRSVQAELDLDCGTQQLKGQVSGFEGPNLSGRRMALEPLEIAQNGPGAAKVVTLVPQAEGLKLLTNQILRAQCAEGHRALAVKYGPDWRPLLSDESGVRLISSTENVGLDRKIDVTFRIEAQAPQADPKLKWRSAISKMKLDCVDGVMSADTTLYSGANETGNSANVIFEGQVTPMGLRTHAPGEALAPTAAGGPAAAGAGRGGGRGGFGLPTDTGPGGSVVGMLRSGAMVLSECEAAKAKLANALLTPGDPLRRQAEAWAGQSLNTKGFRLPMYVPEGVFLLSDEVAATQTGGRRAVIRAEFSRPVPTRNGKKMSSRITVIEVDCSGRKVRGLSENAYAKNGARELINEAAAPQAPWADFEEQPMLVSYFEAVCATKPTS